MKFLILAVMCVVGSNALLSEPETKLVQGTWAQVKGKDVDILYAVFKAFPVIQAQFPQFTGKNLDDLKGTPEFSAHAGRIIGFFSEAVALAGDASSEAALSKKLEDLAVRHKTRGATKELFTNFRTAVMSFMKAKTTPFDADTEKAWGKLFDQVYAPIFKAL